MTEGNYADKTIDPSEIFAFAFSIQSAVTWKQGKILLELAKNAPGGIAELGSWLGRSSLILAAGALQGNKQKIYCIDTWENCDIKPYFDFFPAWKNNIEQAGAQNVCLPQKEDLVLAAKTFDASSFGLIFVDAWHTRLATDNAFRAWWNRLIPGKGKMVFHDCVKEWPGVLEFVAWLELQPQFGKVERLEGMAILTRAAEGETPHVDG